MPSFATVAALVVVLVVGGAEAAVLPAPMPAITPGPHVVGVETFIKRDNPDAISLAKVLLTAIPSSLRQVAATNLPALSSILWYEFLDDKKPEWFTELPSDVQSYLIRQFGPSTAWQTATVTGSDSSSNSSATTTSEAPISKASSAKASSKSGLVTSIVTTSISSISNPIAVPSSTSSVDTVPPAAGLSRGQKIRLGVGVPLAVLAGAAILLGCYFLLRRRKGVNGSQPPSSPGFIPRFAFQEKSEYHVPLNGNSRGKHVSQDTSYSGYSNWDDDVIEPMENTQRSNGSKEMMGVSTYSAPPAAPPFLHSHSSNRARGTRTSYSSLHPVAEMHEPDESPVLPRDGFRPSPSRRTSFGLVPGPAQTKRKSVPSFGASMSPSGNTNTNTNRAKDGLAAAAASAAASASQNPLRPMPDHSQSSSTNSSNSSQSHRFGNTTHITASPVTPVAETPRLSKNPFSNDYYVEDYGPEYTNVYSYDGLETGLYGDETNMSRYPRYSGVPVKYKSKTEWPLRNAMEYRRDQSPMWDRIYEG